ncbi:MAG TPA: hypothetical protein VGR45_10295, partial [Stellaceae bacterium]|nr:hypothetical protein [Stellaceae bacterium]
MTAAAKPPVYFLLHIPKTAGQTIQQHFAANCAPGVFWQSRPGLRRSHASPGDLPDPRRARIVAGHQLGKSLEALFPGREIRRVLLLRDPIDLLVSLYNWQMMDHLFKGWGTYGFDLHLAAQPRNFVGHFLLTRWLELPQRRLLAIGDEEKYEILNRALAGFWFVGAHTDCDRLIAAIGPEFGVPPVAPQRNASLQMSQEIGWPLLEPDGLPTATRDRILAENRMDLALWQSWRSAGFDPGSVLSRPLAPGRRSGYFRHELVRPWFKLRRLFHRRWIPLLRLDGGTGAHVSHANLARDRRDWDRARRHYRRALKGMANAAAIWVQYGHALKESGHLREAEAAYRRSLALRPD